MSKVLIMLVLLLSACGSAVEMAEIRLCERDNDCLGGEHCGQASSMCMARGRCAENGDCEPDEICEDNECAEVPKPQVPEADAGAADTVDSGTELLET